jgi:5-methylcytosine-specific restriction endonuclease McrA
VLVLNQNYEPLMVCNAKRALVMLFLGRAETVEASDHSVASVRQSFPLPSVVKLGSYIRKSRPEVKLTKHNVLRRDRHTCQYCGSIRGPMTVDHVVPRSQGGEDTWENLVCACVPCNNRKSNRSLRQSSLALVHRPRQPSFISFIQYSVSVPDHRWKPYLFLERA